MVISLLRLWGFFFFSNHITDLVLGLSKLFLGVLQSSRGKGGDLSPKDTASQFPVSHGELCLVWLRSRQCTKYKAA